LTKEGTLPVEKLPLEDLLYGQQQEIIARYPDAIIAATDGSVLDDGRMGAAVTFLGDEIPEAQQAVDGDPSGPAPPQLRCTLSCWPCNKWPNRNDHWRT